MPKTSLLSRKGDTIHTLISKSNKHVLVTGTAGRKYTASLDKMIRPGTANRTFGASAAETIAAMGDIDLGPPDDADMSSPMRGDVSTSRTSTVVLF